MLKKLTLLAMSVGALLAFAAPAQAANPVLTLPNGEKPTFIEALSTNTISHTSAGTLECTTVKLTAHITTNTNNTATGHGTGSATGTPNGANETEKHNGHCASSGGPLVEVTSVTLKHLELESHTGHTKGTADFQFTFDLRSPPTPGGLIAACTFTGTDNPITKVGTDEIEVSGNLTRVAHSSAFCPNGGTITGKFTLHQHGNPAVPVHIK